MSVQLGGKSRVRSIIKKTRVMIRTRLMLLLGLMLAMASQLNAQHGVSLQGGVSVPAGDLVRAAYYDNNGYASSGPSLTLQYSYQVNELIALVASGSYLGFPISVDAIEHEAAFAKNFTFNNEPGSHDLWTTMGGPALTFSSGLFRARMKILAGYMHLDMSSSTYSYDISSPNSTYNVTVNQSSNSSGSFGYKAGLNFRYAITNHIGVSLSANLIHGQFDQQISVTRTFQDPDVMSGGPNKIDGPSAITAIQPMLGLSADL